MLHFRNGNITKLVGPSALVRKDISVYLFALKMIKKYMVLFFTQCVNLK